MVRVEELKKRVEESYQRYEKEKERKLKEVANQAVEWIIEQFERLLEVGSPVKDLTFNYGYNKEKKRYQIWYQDYDDMTIYEFQITYWRPSFNIVLQNAVTEAGLVYWGLGEKASFMISLNF